MKLIALAKAIQPFIQQGITLEAVYKEILTNTSLPFKTMLKPIDLIKLVFIAKKISIKIANRTGMTERKTNSPSYIIAKAPTNSSIKMIHILIFKK